eukprot:SAG31_NODE_1144_length_9687_cov_10.800167_1_plen_235_part_10
MQVVPKIGFVITDGIAKDWLQAVDICTDMLMLSIETRLIEYAAKNGYPFISMYWGLAILERAAQDKVLSDVAKIASACMKICEHDFEFGGRSLGIPAAGIAVQLIGSNEKGLTLQRATILAVSRSFAEAGFFDTDGSSHYQSYLNAQIVVCAQRLRRAMVADANKKIFLEQETADMLYDALLDGLLLDDNHPRRSQPAADTLQRVCAEALQELALSAEGEAALKGNTRAMDALRK